MKLPFLVAFSVLHFVVGVCCLLTAISISVVEGKLSKTCGLYIEVAKASAYTSSTPDATCKYVKIMPGVTFAVSLLLMAYHLYPVISRLRRRSEVRYDIGDLVCWCTTIAIGVMLFVASCIISVGFSKSCSAVKSINPNLKLSCKQTFDFTKFDFKAPDTSLYIFLSIAEITSWTAFLGTGAVIAISSLLLFNNRCKETHS